MEIHCPHCHQHLWIEEINCGIFRCGVYKDTFEPLPPHFTQNECTRVRDEGIIYGCAQPFRFDGTHVTICEYI